MLSRTMMRGSAVKLGVTMTTLAVATLAAVGCGDEGDLKLSSVSTGAGGAAGSTGTAGKSGSAGSAQAGTGGSAGMSGSSGQAGAAGAPIRTVTQRNPYGHVEQTDNLLWDGDFEWTGPFVQQYAWSQGKSYSVAALSTIRIDAKCRSGLKCAFVKKSLAIGGVGVSPTTPTTRVHGWAKVPAESTCSKAAVYLAGCFGGGLGEAVKPVSETPGTDGWCEYSDDRTTLTETPCVYVVNKTTGEIVVDDMYLGPGPSTATPSSLVGPGAAADLAAIDDIRADLRDHRRDPPAPKPMKPLGRAPRVR